jgi:hypothetical protein
MLSSTLFKGVSCRVPARFFVSLRIPIREGRRKQCELWCRIYFYALLSIFDAAAVRSVWNRRMFIGTVTS